MNDNTDNNKNTLGIDTSLVAFAKDAADNLNIIFHAEQPLTSGYYLLAYSDNGKRKMTALHGKASHLVEAICDALEQDRDTWQLFDEVLQEFERRLKAKGYFNFDDTKKITHINNNKK